VNDPEHPSRSPLIDILFWIAVVASVATCCICGGMIKGWW
jgi:hypothetical protein